MVRERKLDPLRVQLFLVDLAKFELYGDGESLSD
jgi:hypothetical protein